MWLSLVDRIAEQASDVQLRKVLVKLLELEKNVRVKSVKPSLSLVEYCYIEFTMVWPPRSMLF